MVENFDKYSLFSFSGLRSRVLFALLIWDLRACERKKMIDRGVIVFSGKFEQWNFNNIEVFVFQLILLIFLCSAKFWSMIRRWFENGCIWSWLANSARGA